MLIVCRPQDVVLVSFCCPPPPPRRRCCFWLQVGIKSDLFLSHGVKFLHFTPTLQVETRFIFTPYKVIRKNFKTSSHSIKEMANCTHDRGKQKYRKHDACMLNNLQEEWLFKLSQFDCTFCNGPCVYKTKHLLKYIKTLVLFFVFEYAIHINT